jgi:hypothetical protein
LYFKEERRKRRRREGGTDREGWRVSALFFSFFSFAFRIVKKSVLAKKPKGGFFPSQLRKFRIRLLLDSEYLS